MEMVIQMIKILFFLFIFCISPLVKAFTINSVTVECKVSRECDELNDNFSSLKREYSDIESFKHLLKIYVANNGVKELSYSVSNKDNSNHLHFSIVPREKVIALSEIHFQGDHEIELPSILPIKKDDYYDFKKVVSTKKIIRDIAKEKGFPRTQVKIEIIKSKQGIELKPKVNLKDPVLVKKLNITSPTDYIDKLIYERFGFLLNNPFDVQQIKTEIERSRKILNQYGFYLNSINMKHKFFGRNEVEVFLDIRDVKNYTFHFQKNLVFDVKKLKSIMIESFIGFRRELDEKSAVQVIKDFYRSKGYLNPVIKVKKREVLDLNKDIAVIYEFDISENERTKFNKVSFRGNSFFESEELEQTFYEKASEQARAYYFDENYNENFIQVLKELYISKGYVNIFIDKPLYRRLPNGEMEILYRVKEGLRSIISDFKINGILPEDNIAIKELISNGSNQHFNPIEFKNDLQRIKSYLQSKGYYYTSIINQQAESLVKYSADNSKVNILIDIDTGPKLYVDQIIIIGNSYTRKILIKREIFLKKGDLLTSQKLESSQTNLLSLGLFSSVRIKPISTNNSKTDLLIFVREKDFGTIELAPGVRSDLGFKFSAAVNYNNLDGMNKRVSFKGTINQRFELGSLDDRRREESSSLVEYDAIAKFAEDHIFYSDLDFTTSLSKSRKRFYAFDADIQRITFGLSQDIYRWLNIGLRYQLETISQFDATNDKEHGHFKIGSMTPTLTFDFRNRAVNTSKGALFSLSYEVANPNFGSQENTDLTVDYYKLVSRNKFYYPLGDHVIFALSTAFGIQENKATDLNDNAETEGYIPNIKVFRLTGADIVRGYEDSEINKLVSNEDISEVEVNNRAYMVNLKVEPRFMLSDTTMLGVFYDAGRVFVNEFDDSKLRSSVGLSFKYLTPVGSLDFDYGIKLLRERDDSGKLDSPGRLHVSIGFF